MSKTTKQRLGARLADLRRKAGLTQEQVASRLGFKAKETLSRIERGEHWVKLDNLEQMARLYGADLADVFAVTSGGDRSEKALVIQEIVDVLREQPEAKVRWVRSVLYPLLEKEPRTAKIVRRKPARG